MNTGMSTGAVVVAILLVLAGLGLVHIWTSGVRAGRRVERQVRAFTQLGRVAGAALASAAVITAVQWLVVTYSQPSTTWAFVLGLPALLAGVTVGRMLAVVSLAHDDPYGRRGVHR